MADLERIRLVLLGGAGVGKSSIVKRFLFKSYTDKYRATVEDLYNREYDLGGVTLKVDILDTSGDMQFPAMRRLSIATAHAFMLVYAATSAPSFQCVKQCFEEIREQRGDFQDIPIVIAGNKADLAPTHREVKLEEVTDWVFCELPRLRAKVLECSAKEDNNVTELFKSLLSLSRYLPASSGSSGPGGAAAGEAAPSGFKRRSSAYVSASSSRNKNRMNSPALGGAAGGSSDKKQSSSHVDAVDVASTSAEAKLKPRSRSLIRRASRKTKQQINNASDDCNVQ
ncbi:GTP-binding protein Di-Ras2 [Drosophila subobscura]|uniref:GTP-binding protein Di-Ras2 n=1 Tax=Drosophila subobscura TaxID=7241 RepID=UPI00155B12D5|nr:GTP-binding protein Di-Ras2 [Drosophila subobscura]XP_034652786.1 GTP-binding protein Di-Ras2 [Drosophila subobscura]